MNHNLFSEGDEIEAQLVADLIKQVDNIGIKSANDLSDRIAEYQPFMMSLILGYTQDVEPEFMDDIIKMFFVVFLFFEKKTNIKKKKIDLSDFEIFQEKNFQFLNYLSGEKAKGNRMDVNSQNLSNIKFKSLFTGILFLAKNQPRFKKMNPELQGVVILGMKILIECLEWNLLDKK